MRYFEAALNYCLWNLSSAYAIRDMYPLYMPYSVTLGFIKSSMIGRFFPERHQLQIGTDGPLVCACGLPGFTGNADIEVLHPCLSCQANALRRCAHADCHQLSSFFINCVISCHQFSSIASSMFINFITVSMFCFFFAIVIRCSTTCFYRFQWGSAVFMT